MEENKVLKQIVPLDVNYSSKKEGKSNMILMELRRGKMEWVLYDSLDNEQCDMWGAYRLARNTKLVGCWAHVRRKFFEANPKNSKTSLSAEGLNYCNKLFQLEQEWDTLPVEKRHQKRQKEMKPIMDKFFDWCREHSALPGSKLGKAIEYSLKYESTFRMILEDGNLVLSNNLS